MKLFLLDLWHDLREKRLWPVALALAVALVAVPVVLSKPTPEPPPPAPQPVEDRAEQDLKGLAKVVLADQETGKGSKLNLFDSSNPFKPPKGTKKAGEQSDGGGSQGSGATGSTVGDSVSGGGSLGGGSLGGGTGGGSTTPAEPQSPAPPKTTQFTYVIDATFSRGDNTRKIKGMQRLEMLPNESAPLLLFLGVDAKANNAVFLVDSRLEPTGEGRCKPSRDDCSFLYLGAGSEELFTDPDGQTYSLRIDEIRKVKVKAKSARAHAGKRQRSRKGDDSKPAAESAQQERRPFIPRLLTDLVTVSSGSADPSRTGKTGR
jgi:hypothetical protein